MEAIENITSVVPFMVSPGNHDTRNQSYRLFTHTFFSPYWEKYYNYFYSLKLGSV